MEEKEKDTSRTRNQAAARQTDTGGSRKVRRTERKAKGPKAKDR